MNPLSIGTKFKKNELLASTKNFSNKENMYVSGRNVNIAVMNYLGYNYQPSTVRPLPSGRGYKVCCR